MLAHRFGTAGLPTQRCSTVGVRHGPWFARVDREVLSGDGTRALQTPPGKASLLA